jgi:putative transposase
MRLLEQHKPERLALSVACACLDINRSSLYARHAPTPGADSRQRATDQGTQPRALSPQEREQVLAVLNSAEFCDQPPPQVYRKLLEQGEYLCSVSTMYRLLRAQGQSGDRRNQRPAQHHAVPRLVATKPNQVWTWDITKLPLPLRQDSCTIFPELILRRKGANLCAVILMNAKPLY